MPISVFDMQLHRSFVELVANSIRRAPVPALPSVPQPAFVPPPLVQGVMLLKPRTHGPRDFSPPAPRADMAPPEPVRHPPKRQRSQEATQEHTSVSVRGELRHVYQEIDPPRKTRRRHADRPPADAPLPPPGPAPRSASEEHRARIKAAIAVQLQSLRAAKPERASRDPVRPPDPVATVASGQVEKMRAKFQRMIDAGTAG